MSDELAESPFLARPWCPVCEPDRNPAEEILDTRYCGLHAPSYVGADDAGVVYGYLASSSSEAGGEGNRVICDLVHGASR